MPSKTKKTSSAQISQPAHAVNLSQTGLPVTELHSGENGSGSAAAVNGQRISSRADADSRTGDTTESAGELTAAPAVNRKKQKRREKEAARRAAETHFTNGDVPAPGQQNGHLRQGRAPATGFFTEEPDYLDPDFADVGSPEDAFYSGDDDPAYVHDIAGAANSSWLNTNTEKKDPKNKKNALQHPGHAAVARTGSAHKMSNDQIWNTSTQAERENIKQFWLELGEEERRSLVKVEKEAVLRKMKEQQKHSCSCSVCGRKRTAIEEELEVLYDAYYEELEQFANHNSDLPNGPQVMAPPRTYKQLRGPTHPMAGSFPSRGRVQEVGENDEDLDEDDEYDEEEEQYSDDLDHELPPGPPDFFQFGNSLTVKDGILTVADDLLKNDGKHFIDMMEQLAERRMQREAELHYPSSALAHQDIHQGHNHPPIDDEDDYDDDEEDEDYDSQDEDEYEGDEMDSMTEEQRMEEGRRMFQIFAARMFEQRVLTAYREKVAHERQQKLLEELDEESRLDTQREAKKAREAAKKKEKKKQQKAVKEEVQAKKDAEKAAQEAAAREVEDKKLEEQRQRKEEQRRKRDAEKRAAEEDRLRKEADKQRRAQEERDRLAETDRRQREAKEREKKKRDDARRKEKDDREAKEREVRDRKAKEDKERRAKDDPARKEKETGMKDRAQPPKPQLVALPPGLHPATRNPQLQSPAFQVATPIVPPNVPGPGRNRQPSQPGQQSHTSSPRSQKASTEVSHSSSSPATGPIPQTPSASQSMKSQSQTPLLHHPQPSAPRSPLNNTGRGQFPYNMNGLPGLGVSGPPVSAPGTMPGMMPPMSMYHGPPVGQQHRFAPNGMQYPPGFGGPRPFQQGQASSFHNQPPGSGPPAPPPTQVAHPPTHSRQTSGSIDNMPQPAPISRPGPIARPSSTTPDKQRSRRISPDTELELIATQLGSKALLDDSDEPISHVEPRSSLAPVGAPGIGRTPFGSTFSEPKQDSFGIPNPGWGSFNSGVPGNSSWRAPASSRPSAGWLQPPFGAIGGGPQSMPRSHAPRPIAVRLMLVQACRQLSSVPGSSPDGFYPVRNVQRQVENLKPPGEPFVSMDEMLGICDTEGNVQNGGGSFEVMIDEADGRGQVLKYVEDGFAGPGLRNSVGDIGSPLQGHAIGQGAGFGTVGSAFGPPGRGF